jgi:hypothetical protein
VTLLSPRPLRTVRARRRAYGSSLHRRPGGAEDPFLDLLCGNFRHGPIDVGPFHRLPSSGLFSLRCLTSPSAPTSSLIASAETRRKSAPFRAGYPRLAAALSAPLQDGVRFLRLSSTPSVMTLPCSRASATRRDGWGLPCCPMGSGDRGGCILSSGGNWRHRRQHYDLAILPAYQFWSRPPASWACCG